MSIQSLITPAMFIVSALVLPMSRKTAWRGRGGGGGQEAWGWSEGTGTEGTGAEIRHGGKARGQRMGRAGGEMCPRGEARARWWGGWGAPGAWAVKWAHAGRYGLLHAAKPRRRALAAAPAGPSTLSAPALPSHQVKGKG